MIDEKRLRGLMAEEQVTLTKMAEYLGINFYTLKARLKDDNLKLRDVKTICKVLHIADPRPIFFTDLASPQDA